MTWVPAVVTFIPSALAASMAPAITDRAAFPVQRKTTCGTRSMKATLREAELGDRRLVAFVGTQGAAGRRRGLGEVDLGAGGVDDVEVEVVAVGPQQRDLHVAGAEGESGRHGQTARLRRDGRRR